LFFLCLPLAASSQELVLESAASPTSSGGAPTKTISPEASLTEGIISNGVCFSDASSHVNLLTGDMHNWGSGEVLQFGACSDQFAISIALNEALAEAGSGISLDKIHYRWEWINGCFNVTKPDGSEIYCDSDIENRLDENFQPTGEYADQFDELKIVVTITDSNDNIIEQRTYDYETWFHWNRQNEHSKNETTQTKENGAVWQITEDDIELFNHLTGTGTIYSPSHLGNISFIVTSVDNGKFDGYFGPVVRNGETSFTYRSNPCNLDTLYNPTCEGYAEAYAKHMYDKACAASPLYDVACPGYSAAFLTQQCTIDDLYSPACPGYEAAYLDQQCTYDALYDVQCPMYQVAYFDQQCELDGQYDISCPNYSSPTAESNAGEISEPGSVEEYLEQAAATVTVATIPVEIPVPDFIMPEIIDMQSVAIVEQSMPDTAITTESIEMEIAEIELQLEERTNDGPVETTTTRADEPGSESGDSDSRGESGSEPESEQKSESAESKEDNGSGSDSDGKSEESSDDESSESESNDGKEKDTGEDTSSEDGDGKDKEVDESKDTDETIESEEDATGPEKKEEKPEPTEKEKKDSRTKKIKALVAAKIEAITKDMDNADTIEEQMVIQAQLLALIAFVPDFDYGEMEVPDIYFYPPKPTVDHEFARWFVNDPNFGIMEDSQYPNLRK